ncbi:NAD(P)/FAD-dependent oxidoreductase [Streptomyces sp. WMMC897]|nr:NAD(P)/FAD-dependent oxidoreductase [Streptomyces sp. WMMC897]MCZ7414820.1 NAD(P)/FAD-dependent oxidoreductase [Streptomyces sp. WMMC897]
MSDHRMTFPVHVVGAGPAGLATAAALTARGIHTVVLEKSDRVGAAWRAHRPGLRLHTTRRWSALPGLAVPRSAGRWASRDAYVSYLERYAEHHRLEIATGVEVSRIERLDEAGGAGNGGRWLLRANGGRELRADVVVVATGLHHTPRLPEWPGRDDFPGPLRHSADYPGPEQWAGLDVLVVGAGNTGTEIATELAAGGAARVRLAVRSAPHLVRRSTAGWPAQAGHVLLHRLPIPVTDRAAALWRRLTVPDLAAQGLPQPDAGLYTRAREGRPPVVDSGFVRAVRRGEVEPVAAVESFEGEKVHLADGSTIAPQAVIAATGYRNGLEELVAHLGVLDGRGRPLPPGRGSTAPGLHFTGYTDPVGGPLRRLAKEAGRLAATVAGDR